MCRIKDLLVFVVITMLFIPTPVIGQNQGNEQPMLLPGMVLGLAHNVNQQGYFYMLASDDIVLDKFFGGDLGGGGGEGFYWLAVPDDYSYLDCQVSGSVALLPAGIVLGLAHLPNLPDQSTFGCKASYLRGTSPIDGLRKVHGGDLGGDSGEGYYWFTTTKETNLPTSSDEYWDYLDRNLPMWMVAGLCHSENLPDESFFWRSETYYACHSSDAPPGFIWVNGGDLGADTGTGYYWFEKATGPMIVSKWIDGEGPFNLYLDPISTSTNLMMCRKDGIPTGWELKATMLLPGFCGTYIDFNDVNMNILSK